MSIQIEDGTGQSYKAEVDNRNRIQVVSVSKLEDKVLNEIEQAWTINQEDFAAATTDAFIFYFKNTGDKVLQISDLRIASSVVPTQIEFHAVTGTPAGGTTLSPAYITPKTIGSANFPDADLQYGTNITGLTSTGILYFQPLVVANQQEHLRINAKIRIPKGQAVAMVNELATAVLTGTITIYEEEG